MLLFHVLLVYALITGLAKKVIDVVRAPIETKVIEEVKKPPPPPEVVVPPPPKLEAPPPPFIPPPEIQIATPPPAPTIVATTPTPPPAPVAIAPAPPPIVAAPAPPAPPAPAPTGPVSVGVACTKTVKPELPGVSATSGITGASITYRATTKDGKIVNIEFTKVQLQGGRDSRIQRAFIANVEEAVRQYVCPGDHVFTQEIVFKVTE
ncbi:MAG: energy transducer TonB [Caldimonas sp.]